MGPNLDGLREFAAIQDRDEALFFIGRVEEIDATEVACEEALKRSSHGKPVTSATYLFQGAPGGGGGGGQARRRFCERCPDAGPNAAVGAPLPLIIDRRVLYGLDTLVEKIAKAVHKETAERLRRTEQTHLHGGSNYIPEAGYSRGTSTAPGLSLIHS